MKKRLAGLLLASSFVATTVFAGIADDVSNGIALDVVLKNAVDAGETVESATFEMVRLMPERAGDVVAVALSACSDAVCERSVAQSAIAAGADPVIVTAATAAPRRGFRPVGMSRRDLQRARYAQRVAERRIRPSARTTPLASYY